MPDKSGQALPDKIGQALPDKIGQALRSFSGPGRAMAWGVPEHLCDAAGAYLHDDDLVSSALCAILEREPWAAPSASLAVDLLDVRGMERNF